MKHMNRALTVLIFIFLYLPMAVLLVASFTAGCHKKAEESNAGTPLPVEVATPITREVTLTREYPGYLEADATISIVGRASGTLLKQNYTPGSRVKKGTTLFIIEPTFPLRV